MSRPGRHPYFFLSFAGENDTDDRRVSKFFDDLCDEIGVAAGLGSSKEPPRGFLSISSLRLGGHWSTDIAEALGRCQVFVALCSPSYFRSLSCGVEWRAFEDRLARYRDQHGRPAPSLLPVCWVPMPMPEVAAGIQYTDRDLSAPLARLGLRTMVMLERHRDDYYEFVSRLARLMVTICESHDIPVVKVSNDYSRLPKAFPGTPDPVVPENRPVPRARDTTNDIRLPDLDRGDRFPRLHGN